MRGCITLIWSFHSETPITKLFLLLKVLIFRNAYSPLSRRHHRSFQLLSELGSHLKLHRREKRMLAPIELEPMLLQNDGSNFLPWSIHILNAFRDISPLVEHIVDASISSYS